MQEIEKINKILIVDDDQSQQMLLDACLRKYENDFSVIFSSNGEEAMAILKQENISLLVTDIKMPKVDGLALLTHMNINYPATPCIVLTSYVFPGLEQKLSQKVLYFFRKPIAPEVLVKAIMEGLEQADRDETLSDVSLPGLMQIIEAEEKTCLLSIHADGKKQGIIYFHVGEVYDALCGELRGEAASIKLIAMDNIQVHHQKLPRKKISRQVKTGVQALILEAMRLKDEAAAESTELKQAGLSQQKQAKLLEKGKALCEGLYYKKAQKPLLELVRKYPDNLQGWLWLSRTLSNMNQIYKALIMASKIDVQNLDVSNDIQKYLSVAKVCQKQISRCPFCFAPVPLKENQCHYCRSYFVVSKEILPIVSETVNRKELRQAIERYENVLSREVNILVLFYAGLAWFHLNDFDATLEFFEQLQACVGNKKSMYTLPVEDVVAYIASKQAEKESDIVPGEDEKILFCLIHPVRKRYLWWKTPRQQERSLK